MKANILIAYYTHSGNTQKLANLIRSGTGGTVFEIQPETRYPESYNVVVDQAKREIKAGYRPVLTSKIDDIGQYDTIFIGTPNWWSTVAPPVAAFLAEYDLSKKTVVPFCTHGGGGEGHVIADIEKMCPNATLLPGFAVYGNTAAPPQVSAWLKKIGITD